MLSVCFRCVKSVTPVPNASKFLTRVEILKLEFWLDRAFVSTGESESIDLCLQNMYIKDASGILRELWPFLPVWSSKPGFTWTH